MVKITVVPVVFIFLTNTVRCLSYDDDDDNDVAQI